jgi:AraC-like DNA-binding protein
VAVGWLKESDLPIVEIADQLGYQSEAAFSRAFKKFVGKTAGSIRRAAKSAAGGK